MARMNKRIRFLRPRFVVGYLLGDRIIPQGYFLTLYKALEYCECLDFQFRLSQCPCYPFVIRSLETGVLYERDGTRYGSH